MAGIDVATGTGMALMASGGVRYLLLFLVAYPSCRFFLSLPASSGVVSLLFFLFRPTVSLRDCRLPFETVFAQGHSCSDPLSLQIQGTVSIPSESVPVKHRKIMTSTPVTLRWVWCSSVRCQKHFTVGAKRFRCAFMKIHLFPFRLARLTQLSIERAEEILTSQVGATDWLKEFTVGSITSSLALNDGITGVTDVIVDQKVCGHCDVHFRSQLVLALACWLPNVSALQRASSRGNLNNTHEEIEEQCVC